jgi:hypothetical protein
MHLILCHKAKVTIQGLLSSVCGMKQACRGGWLSTHNRALWWEKDWWWPKSRRFHSQIWSWFPGVCWASCTKVKAFWGETSTVTNYKPCLYQSTAQPLSFVVLRLAFFKHEYGEFLMLMRVLLLLLLHLLRLVFGPAITGVYSCLNGVSFDDPHMNHSSKKCT